MKIRLQRSTVSGKETPEVLKIPDSTRTSGETISTVITIKDDLPVLAVSGRDDTNTYERRFRAIYTIRSVNGALPTDLYVKWAVEDTGGVVDDNRKQGLGKSGYKTLVRGFSEFTVPISIRHDAGAGSATFKITATGRPFRGAPDSDCVGINGGLCPVGSNTAAIEVPDTAVTNVQVTAVDDASAGVSWDAVAHATSYEVSWDGSGSQTTVSGVESVTGTSATIRHDAQEAMTLTVTVTPEHVDGNGVTQGIAALAATATLAVGQGSPEQDALAASVETPSCVSDALLAEVEKAAGETWRTSPGHVERWSRVLAAFGVSNAYSTNPMTVAEAQAQADRGLQRWAPVAPALECLAAAPQELAPVAPAITVTAGAGVTEGASASFTVTASPVPAAPLDVTLTVGQSGDFAASGETGSRTVTVAVSGSLSIDIATVNDAVNEPDGSVSVTVDTGAGYTVGSPATQTVSVADDDDAPASTPELSLSAGAAVDEGGHAGFTVTGRPGAAIRPDDCLDRRPERRVSGRARCGQPDGDADRRDDQHRPLGGDGGRCGGRGRRLGERHPGCGHRLHRGHGQEQRRGGGPRQ